MPRYITSDRFNKYMDDMDYMMGPPEYIPVDLNGARTDLPKSQDNLMKVQEDIQRRFGLEKLGAST